MAILTCPRCQDSHDLGQRKDPQVGRLAHAGHGIFRPKSKWIVLRSGTSCCGFFIQEEEQLTELAANLTADCTYLTKPKFVSWALGRRGFRRMTTPSRPASWWKPRFWSSKGKRTEPARIGIGASSDRRRSQLGLTTEPARI